jgi:IstB-like ATP binding protein
LQIRLSTSGRRGTEAKRRVRRRQCVAAWARNEQAADPGSAPGLPADARTGDAFKGRRLRPEVAPLVDLVNRLEGEAHAGRRDRLAEYLTRMDFVVLDELGYLPFTRPAASFSFI